MVVWVVAVALLIQEAKQNKRGHHLHILKFSHDHSELGGRGRRRTTKCKHHFQRHNR